MSMESTVTHNQQSTINQTRTFWGSILLIAGSIIGAGMLALPVVVGQIGFIPGMLAYGFIWSYMLITGLMLHECLSWYTASAREIACPNGSMLKAVNDLLGPVAKTITIFLFLSLFTCLMVAYIDKGGELLWHYVVIVCVSSGLGEYVTTSSVYGGQILITLITGGALLGGARLTDGINRIGMVILVASFLGLISICLPFVNAGHLTHISTTGIAFILPFLITSFGFHNMIPSITDYNGGFKPSTVKAIIIGSAIPLVVYAIWTLCVLGVIPVDGENGIQATFKAGRLATEALANQTGALTESGGILSLSLCASLFAFSAILTSLFGQGMSVTAFIIESVKKRANQNTANRSWIIFIFLLVCLVLTFIAPNIFMTALEYAGGIFAILLFGIIPSLMLLKGRYVLGKTGPYKAPVSKPIIIGVLTIGAVIFILEILKITHVINLM